MLILGDNLGLNGILGFVECFKANFCCRICSASSSEFANLMVEDVSKIRTKESYSRDVQVSNSSQTGIKEECVFHEVTDFHVTENICVDLMHDVLEGVCMYVMRLIISEYVFGKKAIMTLQDFNTKVQNFDYGINEKNKPAKINFNTTKNKPNLKMSASEMLCLVRYFGFIVGDLVKANDKHWQLFKHLRQIIDILTSPRVVRSDASRLRDSVKDMIKLYLQLGGKIKPKFHHLIHYPRILLDNGPIMNFWSMRYESLHRLLKAAALSSSNTRNLLHTMAIKQMLKTCQMIHSLEFEKGIEFGSLDRRSKHTSIHFRNREIPKKCSNYNSSTTIKLRSMELPSRLEHS